MINEQILYINTHNNIHKKN